MPNMMPCIASQLDDKLNKNAKKQSRMKLLFLYIELIELRKYSLVLLL